MIPVHTGRGCAGLVFAGTTVMIALLLGGCGTVTPPSRVARVVITPGALLFTGADASATLTAKAFDAKGNPVDATFQWSSSDPNAVQIDADGVLTTQVGLGSALVTATAAGVDSFPASIVMAQPVPGAVLVTDDQIVETPTPVDGTSDPIQQRLVLTTSTGIVPGTIVIGAEATAIGGKVVSVQASPKGLVVVYAPLPPQELFDRLSLDEDIDMAAAVIEPAAWLADQGSIRSDGHGTTSIRTTSDMGSLARKPPCEGEAAFVSISGLNTSIENNLRYHLHLQDGAADPKPTTLYVDGNITQKVSGGLSVQAGFSGTYTCKVVLFHIPIPIAGVAALVAAPEIPVGLAAIATGSVSDAGVTVNLEASSGLDLKVGFTDDPDSGFTFFHDVTPKYQAPILTADLVTPAHFRVGVSGFVGLASGIDIRVAGLEDIDLVQAQLGPKQSFDLAGAEGQADSKSYASSYDLSVVASASVGVDLSKLLKWLGFGVAVQFQQIQETFPISKSPSGTFTVSNNNPLPGDKVQLHVALDTDHLTYLTHYNVSKVEIYLAQGNEEPKPYRTIPLSASNQSDFNTEWDTTGLAEGDYRFYAFVVDDLLAKVVDVPLEVAADSEQIVHIAGACKADHATGTLGAMAACTGGTTWDYSQPGEVNGVAWEVHTTGHALTFTQDPSDPNSFHLTDATASWTDDAEYRDGTHGCHVTSQGTNLRVTNLDPNAGTYVSGMITLSPDGTYYGSGYLYVIGGADDGCWGGTKDENVPLFTTSPGATMRSDGHGGSLLEGDWTGADDIGTTTTTWSFDFPDVPPR